MDIDAWKDTLLEWWQWLQTNDYFTTVLNYVASFTIGHKVALLLVIIYVTLRIIGWANGIKKSKFFDSMTPAPNNIPISDGIVRLPRAKFQDDKVLSYYNDLSCTVNFWEVSQFPGWFGRVILRRKASVRDEYRLIILADRGAFQPDYIGIDQHTREALLTQVQKRNGQNATLDGTRWKIELKKDNSVRFLLKHPDSTIRTTAWVVLATSILALIQALSSKNHPRCTIPEERQAQK
jgi:hypothetical protein